MAPRRQSKVQFEDAKKEEKALKQKDTKLKQKKKVAKEEAARHKSTIKKNQDAKKKKSIGGLQDQLKNKKSFLKLLTFDYKPRMKKTIRPINIVNMFDPSKEVSPTIEKTNYFRDGKTPIDLVLVLADDDNENVDKMKLNYVVSIVKTGLEVEIERGTMKKHKNLIFLKIHAPDAILEQHGQAYMSRRYFKDSHMAYINTMLPLFEKYFRCCRMHHEKKWVQIVRQQWKGPFFFSSIERSMIVYQILLLLPFGAHRNYYGLTRLMQNDIVIDVYALHDGPYFVVPQQRLSTMNARQILFYNWFGRANLFKSQPLTLINEYFGGKIALYFAFYAFYNLWLIVPALAGVIAFIHQIIQYSNKSSLVSQYCQSSKSMCPTCHFVSICPFALLSESCMRAKIVTFLSSDGLVVYASIMSVWVFILVLFWNRIENYWVWMWQLGYGNDRFYTSLIRPEYRYLNKAQKRSTVTGVLKNYDSGMPKFMRMLTSSILFLVFLLTMIIVNVMFVHIKHALMFMIKMTNYELITTTMAGFISFIIIFSFKRVYRRVAYCLTDMANHRTYETYMRAVCYKYYCINIVFVCTIIVFYAWLKGALYTYPGDVNYWRDPFKILLSNCGPLPCFDEAFITYAIGFIFHVVLLRIWRICVWLFKRTDYSKGKKEVTKYPSWEREYCLKTITENTIMEKFNDLAVQFTLLTAFAPIFPLGPLIALIVNFWDIKRDARHFLLCCRRPLLLTSPGLDAWKNIFYVVAFFTSFCCGLTLIRTTFIVPTYVYKLCTNGYDNFVEYHLVRFTKDLFYDVVDQDIVDTTFPDQCYMSGAFYITEEYVLQDKLWRGWSLNTRPSLFPASSSLIPKPEYFMEKFYQLMLLIIMENLTIVFMLLIFYLISPMTRDVKETMAVENRIRDLYLHKLKLEEVLPSK